MSSSECLPVCSAANAILYMFSTHVQRDLLILLCFLLRAVYGTWMRLFRDWIKALGGQVSGDSCVAASERRSEMDLKAAHHLQTWTGSWYLLATVSDFLLHGHICINMPLDFPLVKNPQCALAVQGKLCLCDGQTLGGEATEVSSRLLIFLSHMSTVPFRTMALCVLVLRFPSLALSKPRVEDEVFLYVCF